MAELRLLYRVRKDSFWQTDLQIAADELVKIIRETKPQVVITYDDFGGYGHPDHINAHRITHYASDLAKVSSYKPDLGDAWEISKIYWTCIPKSQIQKGIDLWHQLQLTAHQLKQQSHARLVLLHPCAIIHDQQTHMSVDYQPPFE